MNEPLLKRRPLLLGAGVGLIAAASGAAVGQTRGRASVIALPVTGTNTATGQQVFGVFAPQSFSLSSAGTLLVTGLLTLTQGVVQTLVQTVTMAVTNAVAQACTILDLTLGPLHLELLGLVIDLNQVHLVITAVPGAGLLGDLLCALTNLLSGGLAALLGNLAALTTLVGLLNQLIGLFG